MPGSNDFDSLTRIELSNGTTWDGSIAQAAPVVPVTGSGTLTALNSDVIFDNSASYSSISFVISGTWVGTITPAISVDNSTYDNWEMGNRTTIFTNTTVNGTFEADIANYRYFRLRMTSYTSGSASVSYFATTNDSVNKRIVLNSQNTSTSGASQNNQVKTIETEHQQIHSGLLFGFTDAANLNNGGTRRISFQSTATEHVVFAIYADFQCTFRLYEGAVTTDGATITEYNHNRNSANTSSATVKVVTTVTSSGTAIYGPIVFGSSSGNAATVIIGRSNEWDTTANTKYMFEVTSNQNNNDITLDVSHYRNNA